MCSDLALTAVGARFPRFNSTFRFSRIDFVRRDIVELAGLVVESVIAT